MANGKAFVANGFTSQFLLGVLHERFFFQTVLHKRFPIRDERFYLKLLKAFVTNGLPVRRELESIRVSETNAF